jgi:Flp pilus assembly protein CpaB
MTVHSRGGSGCMQEARRSRPDRSLTAEVARPSRRCPSLALALLSLSLTLQAVPATHEHDNQPQACATGSWWRTPLDRRASAVAAVRLPAGRVRCFEVFGADEEVGGTRFALRAAFIR